jgi:hypothetical protein
VENPWEHIGWPLPYPTLVRLLEHWTAKRGGRPCPDKDDCDPFDLVDILPDLFILEVADDPRDYVYAFGGKRVSERAGRPLHGLRRRDVQVELTGRIDIESRRRLDNEFAWVAQSLNGAVRVGDLRAVGRRARRIVRLTLPLNCVNGVAQFLIAAVCDVRYVAPEGPGIEDGFAIDGRTLAPMPLPLHCAPRLA